VRDNFDKLVERWLKSAVEMVGLDDFAKKTRVTAVTIAEVNAYHMGTRDILVRLLRECPETFIQRTRNRLKEHKNLSVLLR
jgi:hypothetical protein